MTPTIARAITACRKLVAAFEAEALDRACKRVEKARSKSGLEQALAGLSSALFDLTAGVAAQVGPIDDGSRQSFMRAFGNAAVLVSLAIDGEAAPVRPSVGELASLVTSAKVADALASNMATIKDMADERKDEALAALVEGVRTAGPDAPGPIALLLRHLATLAADEAARSAVIFSTDVASAEAIWARERPARLTMMAAMCGGWLMAQYAPSGEKASGR